nr:MAG TPA: hypothetical protein [Caudoviricetes sp.]
MVPKVVPAWYRPERVSVKLVGMPGIGRRCPRLSVASLVVRSPHALTGCVSSAYTCVHHRSSFQ